MAGRGDVGCRATARSCPTLWPVVRRRAWSEDLPEPVRMQKYDRHPGEGGLRDGAVADSSLKDCFATPDHSMHYKTAFRPDHDQGLSHIDFGTGSSVQRLYHAVPWRA